MWYAGPGQNNNANFDTDVEAGGASEDENQVIIILIIMIISDEYIRRLEDHLQLELRKKEQN